jgi:hypothetical protein
MSTLAPYTVTQHAQMPGYAGESSDGSGALIETDNTGLVHSSPITVRETQTFVYSTNVPMFEVWTVPPAQMEASTYTLTGWQPTRTTTRGVASLIPAIILNYYDNSDGALNYTTGVFTVPASGLYRHSMTLRVDDVDSNEGSFGAFVGVNGVRTVGDYFLNTGDSGYHDYHHFFTEIWHTQGDEITFMVPVNGGDGATGLFARWVVVRSAASLPVTVPAPPRALNTRWVTLPPPKFSTVIEYVPRFVLLPPKPVGLPARAHGNMPAPVDRRSRQLDHDEVPRYVPVDSAPSGHASIPKEGSLGPRIFHPGQDNPPPKGPGLAPKSHSDMPEQRTGRRIIQGLNKQLPPPARPLPIKSHGDMPKVKMGRPAINNPIRPTGEEINVAKTEGSLPKSHGCIPRN